MDVGYVPDPAGWAHACYVGHVRETTTPGTWIPGRPELAGLLLADCSCGAEYTVPEGPDEFGALEEAHLAHVTEATGGKPLRDVTMPLADLTERRTSQGLQWTASGPRGRVWAIQWRQSLGDIRACPARGGLYGPRGEASTAEQARAEALRIAGLIKAGKTKSASEEGRANG